MGCFDRALAAYFALALISSSIPWAFSEVDIDYSHKVAGVGTIMTDYQLEDRQRAGAFGIMRGTGEVMNSYFFSTNNSSFLKVEDKFVLTKLPIQAESPQQKGFPPWPKGSGSYRLVGKSWADNIQIAAFGTSQAKDDGSADFLEAAKSEKKDLQGEFKFAAASSGSTGANAFTRILDQSNLTADASLIMGSLHDKKAFDYTARWYNSSNVTTRSLIGEPRAVLYEQGGWVTGSSTGLKTLKVSS